MPETETTSVRREEIQRLRRANVSDVRIGKAMNLSARRIRAIAGPRTDALPKPEPSSPAPEPQAAQKGSQRPARTEKGTFATPPPEPETPPGRVLGIGFMGDDAGSHRDWFEDTPEGRGEKRVQAFVGTQARDEYDGFLSGVAAAYRENDEFDAKLSILQQALDAGVTSVRVEDRRGRWETLDASDLDRLRHHLPRRRA